MKLKTLVFGLLTTALMVFLLSGKSGLNEPDFGYNPGEQLPISKVRGELRSEAQAIVVLWSTNDAISRLINSWASYKAHEEGKAFYSFCTNAGKSEAEFVAKLDNVATSAVIMSVNEERSFGLLDATRMVAQQESGDALFLLADGVIQSVANRQQLWHTIQQNTKEITIS